MKIKNKTMKENRGVIGYKVVFCDGGQLGSASRLGAKYIYKQYKKTYRQLGDGPIGVFKSAVDALMFISNFSDSPSFRIYKCRYLPSSDTSFWYCLNNHMFSRNIDFYIKGTDLLSGFYFKRVSTRIGLPSGTDFADWVLLLDEINLYYNTVEKELYMGIKERLKYGY